MSVERDDWICDAVCAELPALLGMARRLTAAEADAEDLVSEAVARAWAARAGLSDRGAFRGWIFRILTNAWIDAKRRADARPALESLEERGPEEETFSLFERLHQPFLLWWSDPERAFLSRLLRRDIAQALAKLPDEYRLVVELCDVQGFRYAEIAELLDVPVGTVKSRLARGRSRLQQELWQHGRDAGLVADEADARRTEAR